MRGNKRRERDRARLDDDDAAYEREYEDQAPAPPARASCPATGKIPILSPGHAADVAKRMRNLYGDPFLEPYKCPCCPWWHVGHSRGTRRMAYDLQKAVASLTVPVGDPYPAAARKSGIRS